MAKRFYLLESKNSYMNILEEYRQNVGIVLLKNELIFAGFRIDVPENSPTGWQMPQGGIDEGEDVLTAGYRELYEETGIKKEKIKLIKILPETIKYDFTPEAIELMKKRNKIVGYNGKFYKGQEQHWIVFEFLGNDSDINLKPTDEPQEFRHFGWKTPDFLVENVFEMKKEVYKKVFELLKKEEISK